jgi:hypothetical protein
MWQSKRALFLSIAVFVSTFLGILSCTLANRYLWKQCIPEVLPEVSIEQSVQAFVGKDTYSAHELVVAAREAVATQVSRIGTARIGRASADYTCSGDICSLQRMTVDVTVVRDKHCPNDRPVSTEVLVSVSEDFVRAKGYSDSMSDLSHNWEDIRVPIDEALNIALKEARSGFVKSYPQFSLSIHSEMIASTAKYWGVFLYKDLNESGPADLYLQIDNTTGSILRRWEHP